ncbi:hypothetical protein CSB20_04180 [bacterium DOLZORAL124_64_63]|nr:MAG: hypothetical protein CSB20_04180 [bacterium DOLZORAL124_64_63]
MDNEFTIGQIFDKSFQIFTSNIVFMLLASLLISLPSTILNMLSGNVYIVLSSVLVTVFIVFLAQALVVYGVFQHLTGRKMVFSQSLKVALRQIVPVLVVAFVVISLTMLGFLMLVIPGAIVHTMLWVAVPVIIVEKGGLGHALRRSMTLTQGYRWRIFFLMFILGVLNSLMQWIEQMAMAGIFLSGMEQNLTQVFLVSLPLSVLLSGMVGVLISVVVTVGYYTLRHEVEMVAPGDLASVFE